MQEQQASTHCTKKNLHVGFVLLRTVSPIFDVIDSPWVSWNDQQPPPTHCWTDAILATRHSTKMPFRDVMVIHSETRDCMVVFLRPPEMVRGLVKDGVDSRLYCWQIR
jgi:hypothetical protein